MSLFLLTKSSYSAVMLPSSAGMDPSNRLLARSSESSSVIRPSSLGMVPAIRGLHSSTFRLNVRVFCATRGVYGVFRGYLWRGWRGCLSI